MKQSKFFEAFMKQQKKEKKYVSPSNKKGFFFCLKNDDQGVFIKCVGSNLKEKKVNPESCPGHLKRVVELYNNIKAKNRLIVDWNNPHSNIYLDQYPELLEQLPLVDNLIDGNGKAVYCGQTEFPIVLNIIENDEFLICNTVISDSKIDRLISEKYVLTGNRLLATLPLGPGYKSLLELNTTIKSDELGSYLSIVCSNFDNIKIEYNGYKTNVLGVVELSPSLIIDSIDESGFLTINTTFSYNDLISPEFYFKFRPSKVVIPNKLDQILEIYDLRLPDIDVLDSLVKNLFYIEKEYDLNESFNIEENGVIINGDMAHILFNSELKFILDNFSIYGEKFLKKNRLKKSKVNLELLLTSAIDYLQGSASLQVYGESIPLYQGISIFDKKGYIPLKDGSRGVIDRNYIDKIRKVIREGKTGVELSFFDLPYIENELEASVKGDNYLSKLKKYKSNLDDIEVPAINLSGLNGKLRPYQEEGVKWLMNLHQIGISGCLSDDMGLGKTVQVLTLLLQVLNNETKPTLIILPKSLIFNWVKEIEKFTPSLNYSIYYGGSRNISEISGNKIIFTTYHTLRNDIEKIKPIEFFYTILDEIQHIKNHTSKLARACFLIKSEYRLGISGTPVENSLSDLYSISRFLNPTLFGSFKKFKEEWSGPITTEDSPIVSNLLRSKIKPIFLRRLKECVLDDLPQKTEQVLYVDMEEKQKSYYEVTRKDYHDKIRLKIREEGLDKSQITIIRAFMELRQIATIPEIKSQGVLNSPKQELLLEQVIETIDGGHKVLIFSNFLGAIKGIDKGLKSEGINCRVITGATQNREKIVEEFQEDDSVMALIMTLKTGGVGLNLTAASYVYIFDPWWNLSSENQAIDRTYRIGQKNSVFCYRLIARGTIEEKILELHEKKRALFDNLFTASASGNGQFTTDDIDYLLG